VRGHPDPELAGQSGEPGDERRRRVVVHVLRCARLHQDALFEHPDHVGERERLRLVVRDVHGGRARLADQRGDLHPHSLAQVGVQVGQRLVAQDQPGVGDQRPGQRDPLLLASGQLVRVAPRELAQPHPLQHRRRARPARGPRQAAPAERERDVGERGHVRPQCIVLEHHRQVTLVGRHVRPAVRDGLPANGDQPAVDPLDARQAPQHRRLARA
jgi:hypothetical protein